MLQLLDTHRAALIDLCKRWGIVELSIFGSALRDDFRPESDVDLLVVFEPNRRLDFSDLDAMEAGFAAVFGRRVDLVEKVGLRNPIRRRAILSSSRLLYAA